MPYPLGHWGLLRTGQLFLFFFFFSRSQAARWGAGQGGIGKVFAGRLTQLQIERGIEKRQRPS